MKSLSSGIHAAITGDLVICHSLCAFEFDSGTVFLTDAPYSIVWDETTWIGLGELVGLEPIKTSRADDAQDIQLTITGVPVTNRALVLTEPIQGRSFSYYRAYFDMTTGQVVDAPLEFVGLMDVLKYSRTSNQKGPDYATISLTIRNRMGDWDKQASGRYSDADQRARYPDDAGMQFVAAMVQEDLKWGQP